MAFRDRAGCVRLHPLLPFVPALATGLLLALVLWTAPAQAQTRVGDITTRPGDVPRRVVGYGLVVGLDGTGDRSFGGLHARTPTVRSVVNLLKKFDVEVPAERLRLRNVAAVLVTAEISPYLRAGGRFEVQVAALGDASSLRGGVLWITPLVLDPNEPPIATAQGPLYMESSDYARVRYAQQGNSARIAEGGLLEVDLPAPATGNRLLLKQPDLGTAQAIANAVQAAFGAGSARVDDPGAVTLTPPQADDALGFLAAVDTVEVTPRASSRVVINAREGTIVAGGGVSLGSAVVSHHGITLQIGGGTGGATQGLVRVAERASVQDVAAGLHAAGARPEEVAAIFEALRASGSLRAEVVIR